ncbi:MAG: hypothetical protein GX115_06295 [Ruminiclostridium sp.]|nr:hypothetical protein [Ruminiclostridium sp.]
MECTSNAYLQKSRSITKKAAKRLFVFSYLFFIGISVVFFFPPSVFWTVGFILGSLLAGGCVAAWGFYLKSGTPKNRIKTVADMLILSNILMILIYSKFGIQSRAELIHIMLKKEGTP